MEDFFEKYEVPIHVGGILLTLLLISFFLDTSFVMVTDFLHNWQELAGSAIGAFIGALTAISIFVATEYYKNKNEQENHCHLLHRSIGAALNNLSEIDATLHVFALETLPKIIRLIETQDQHGLPAVTQGFVPLLHVADISSELLKRFSGSGYIDIKTIILVNRSKDLRKMVDDIDRQFDRTLLLNTQIALSGINRNPSQSNHVFKENLKEFEKFVTSGFLKNNLPMYARDLIQTQVALGKLRDWGPRKWSAFFKEKNIRMDEHMVEDIDAILADEVDARIQKYQSEFKSILEVPPIPKS